MKGHATDLARAPGAAAASRPGALAQTEREPAFEVMRALAALSVIVVHVLGPYRERLGEIPDGHWSSAIALNGFMRWGVPIFIMITGALMLADRRPFRAGYFLRRRLLKVLVPFLWWSAIYAVVAGVTLDGFDPVEVGQRLRALPTHETYYHLGFFYYFIPLYLLVLPLRLLAQHAGALVVALLAGWLGLTTLYLAGGDGFWSVDLLMFGGYLLLGYVLWRVWTPPLALVAVLGLVSLAAGSYAVVTGSLEAGHYDIGRWYAYKTVNTVLAATLVFVLALRLAPHLSPARRRAFEVVGRYSLGIYLLHPLFLWPVRAFDLYGPHPLLVIPFWTVVAGAGALGTSMLLARSRSTAWMVP